jgi:hypothetical protein
VNICTTDASTKIIFFHVHLVCASVPPLDPLLARVHVSEQGGNGKVPSRDKTKKRESNKGKQMMKEK